ncbi:MAG: acyl--CoA ligase [Deltaproteobacteria bacterium]|nr:MAG: acyl--CoA ligase [Deltaproteobacteria bacterium]
METLGAFLDAAVARAPAREALAAAPRAEVTARLGWAELRAASREAAKKLLAAGAGKGSRVGLLCTNRLEWLPIAFGALRLGAVLVPLSTLWKRDELAHALGHADVQLLVMLDRATPGALGSPRLPALRQVVLLDGEAAGCARWSELPAAVDDAFLDAVERAVSPVDWATVFFTSGTTAEPKAVVHAHGALATAARGIAERLGIGPDDAWWGHLPLFWSGGFVLGALATIAGGGRVVLQEVVDAASALELLEREACTIMAGWHQAGPLLEHPEFAGRRLRLRKGTRADPELTARLLGPDHHAVGCYGMSETATFVSAARWDDPEPIRLGTFGRPLEGMEIRIEPAVGEEGEILVRGPTLMEGYYGVPRATTFDAEGFFRTGDLGFVDPAGFLHFTGRLKDVIKTAGVNVAASEVEAVLRRHPAVQAAHVVGVRHPTRGENVAAFVVFKARGGATPEELQGFCGESLASYKVPRHVFVVAEGDLPRTASGKVEKAALRRLAETRAAGTPF